MIDNTKYYNDSLAYDFELFMPREKKEKVHVTKKTSAKKTKKAKKNNNVKSRLIFALISVFVIIIMLINIFIRAEINNVTSQIATEKYVLNALSGERTGLQMKLANGVSLAILEEKALALGMRKIRKDQIVYIKINDKDIAISSDGKALKSEGSE